MSDRPATGTAHAVAVEADLRELQAVLRDAVGEVRDVATSYGDVPEIEFSLEAGSGLWTISPEASTWTLYDEARRGPVLDSGAETSVTSLRRQLLGEKVKAVTARFPTLDLIVEFEGGKVWVAQAKQTPDFDPVTDQPLPTWEIFTPDRTVLAAGPGKQWVEYAADVPEARLPWSSMRPDTDYDLHSDPRPRRPVALRLPRMAIRYTPQILRGVIALAVVAVALSVVSVAGAASDELDASVSLLLATLTVILAAALASRRN